MSNSPSCGG